MSISATTSTTIRRDSRDKFFSSVNATLASSPLKLFVSDFTSDRSSLISGWAGAVPSPQRRNGPTVHRSVNFYEHTVSPVIWDNTVDVDISTMKDAQAIGVSIDIAAGLGFKNARHAIVRATQVLELGTGSTVATAYDSVSFFNDAHAESGSNQDNNFTSAAATGTTPTAAELESAITSDIIAMMGFTDDQGDIFDIDASNFTLMFPLAYWAVTHKVLGGNGTVGTGPAPSAVGTQTTDANDTLPTGLYRGTYNYFFNPLMTNSDRFYLLRSPRAGNVAPLIFNMREPWDVMVKTPVESDYAVENDVIWFTSKARYDCGYGDWRAAAVHVFT